MRLNIILRAYRQSTVNWLRIPENSVVGGILSVLVIVVLVTLAEKAFVNTGDVVQWILVDTLLLILPLTCTGVLLAKSRPEERLLQTLLSTRELHASKITIAVLSNSICFALLLACGFRPPVNDAILIALLILLLSPLQYYLQRQRAAAGMPRARRSFLSIGSVQDAAQPLRGIMRRDLLALGREGKVGIFCVILLLFGINAVIVYLSLMNNLIGLYGAGLILQGLIVAALLLNFRPQMDAALLRAFPHVAFLVFRAQLLLWLTLGALYFSVLSLLYYLILPEVSLLVCGALILGNGIVLALSVLIRLAFRESELLRNLIILLVMIPPAIPVVVYSCFRRLRC